MAKLSKKDAVEKLAKAKNIIPSLRRSPHNSSEFEKWHRNTRVAIEYVFGTESKHLKEFRAIDYSPGVIRLTTPDSAFKQSFLDGLSRAEVILQSMIEEIEEYWSDGDKISRNDSSNSSLERAQNATPPCVFIGHGRNKLWAMVKLFLEDDLGLATITYESETRVGESIVPILEKMLDQADFAILVLTAEDETVLGTKRARQNVIHEAGLFQGRLGFRRAVILRQDGLEDFSNVAGLQYISFANDKIKQSFYEIQRVLKREGLLS